MPKARLVFDGDNVYIGKDGRIYGLKNDIASKIDGIPGVIDSLDSTSTTDALSANMGRDLQDQINAMSGIGTFLSTWDCTTGLPGTNPQEDPYTYKAGDYYVVSAVGATNYKPHGGTFTQGVPSTTVETENVGINDKYYFDGADWVRIPNTAIQITIDSALSTSSTNAVENRAIANAVNAKQDIISDLSTIRTGAGKGATAVQPNDNITQLTNNAGYQTAGDVATAIAGKQDILSAGDGISILNNTVTNTKPGPVISGTAPSNPTEGTLWYDSTNDVLKVYDGSAWQEVGSDAADINTKTFYLASTSDLTNAQAAYDWYKAGKNPIIRILNRTYDVYELISGNLVYKYFDGVQRDVTGGGKTLGYLYTLTFNISSDSVISVTETAGTQSGFLQKDNSSAFTPTGNYNPATKKYVDDSVANVVYSGSTAPVNPTEGQLWYDTTNDVLKAYDGTNWNIVGGDLSNYLAKNNTTSYTPSGNYNPATKKYVDDSVAGTGIIDLSSSPRPSAVYYGGRIGFDNSTGNFYGSDGSDWKEISYKNVFCENVPMVGDSVENLIQAQRYSVILLSFNESMSDKWIVTDLTSADTDLGTPGKITAIGYVEESDTTYLQPYGFTEWPKGVTILEITWDWDSNENENVCTNLRFLPSSTVSGGTFGAFARECVAYGTEHKTTLHKYSTQQDGDDRGTATYTMQGMGMVTGRGWSANNGTVSIAINGLTVWSENNSTSSHTFKWLTTPMTLSPGDIVSVTMSATNSGNVYADISDFY